MLARVYACALYGLEGHIIEVEVDFNPRAGVPIFTIVGLPDAAVKESRERVRAAIKNSRLSFPNHIHNSLLLVLLRILHRQQAPDRLSAACTQRM